MRTRCQAREEVKPSPSAGEHAKAKSGSVLHLLLSITFFLETLNFRRRVLLDYSGIGLLGIDGFLVLLRAIPFSE